MKGKYSYKFFFDVLEVTCVKHPGLVTVEQLGYSRDKWDTLTDDKRDAILHKACNKWAVSTIVCGWGID